MNEHSLPDSAPARLKASTQGHQHGIGPALVDDLTRDELTRIGNMPVRRGSLAS